MWKTFVKLVSLWIYSNPGISIWIGWLHNTFPYITIFCRITLSYIIAVADILLWRDEKETFTCFIGLFLMFYWFFLSGRTFISSVAKLLLLVTVMLSGQAILPSNMWVSAWRLQDDFNVIIIVCFWLFIYFLLFFFPFEFLMLACPQVTKIFHVEVHISIWNYFTVKSISLAFTASQGQTFSLIYFLKC